MTEEVRQQAERVIRQLQQDGHTEEARHLERALETDSLGTETLDSPSPETVGAESLGTRIADAFPLALREACQIVLTAIEAIDPNTEMLLEQLRAKIDALLTPQHPAGHSEDSAALKPTRGSS